jgi:hypothetical protein
MAARLKDRAARGNGYGNDVREMDMEGKPQSCLEFRSRPGRRKDRPLRFGGPRALRGATELELDGIALRLGT